eukprot:Sspe_Gene.55225::Locus_30396_Transcript_1_1_Confidence_1.000_Length_3425::g.55225::m.55225
MVLVMLLLPVCVLAQGIPPLCPRGDSILEDFTRGTANVNVQEGQLATQLTCGALEDVHRRYPSLNITTVTEATLRGQPYGRFLNEEELLLIQESLYHKQNLIEMLELDDPWVGTVAEHLVGFDPKHPALKGYQEGLLFRNAMGEVIAVPKRRSSQVILYRKDLFRKYGYSYPKTWDEFEATLGAIQEKESAELGSKFYGFTIATDDSANRITYTLISILSGDNGGTVVEDDGTISINRPEGIRSIARWKRWLETIVPPEAVGMDTGAAWEHFRDGKCAAVVQWTPTTTISPEELHHNFTSKGWELAVGGIPGDHGAGVSGSWYIGLSKYSANLELAKELFLAVAEGIAVNDSKRLSGNYVAKEEYIPPAHRELMCQREPIMCRGLEEQGEALNRFVRRPSVGCGPLYPDCQNIVFKHMNDVFLGRSTAEEAARGMERDLKQLLGHYEQADQESDTAIGQEQAVLITLSTLCCVALLCISVWVVTQAKHMRKTEGLKIPVAFLLSTVVTIVLVVVLSIVITLNYNASKDISNELASKVRTQSLRGVKGTVETTLHGLLLEQRSIAQVRQSALASANTYLGRMQISRGSLVVMVDQLTREILLTSDPAAQPRRAVVAHEIEASENITSWVKAGLRELGDWASASTLDDEHTYVIEIDGDRVYLNMELIAVEMEIERQNVNGVETNIELQKLRKIRWLLMYFTPDHVILGKANDSRETVLYLSIALSLVAVVFAACVAVFITSPLVQLATDVESVALMKIESLHRRTSFLKEVAALMESFRAMCAMMEEYKAFMPKTIFETVENGDGRSGGEEEEEGSGGEENSTRASTLSHEVEKEGVVVFGTAVRVKALAVYNTATTLMIRMCNFHTDIFEGTTGMDSILELMRKVEVAVKGTSGTVHHFAAAHSGDLFVTWNVGGFSTCAQEKAAHLALELQRSSPVLVGLGMTSGKCKAGNMGTDTMRGFAVTGPAMAAVKVVTDIAELVATKAKHSIALAAGSVVERVHGQYKYRKVDLIWLGDRIAAVYQILSLRHSVVGEWMYELESAEATDPFTTAVTAMQSLSCPQDVCRALAELEGQVPDDDPVAQALLHRLKCPADGKGVGCSAIGNKTLPCSPAP